MTLMEKVEADYYMFSDQDDEWLPEKILVTMKKMMEEENEAPEKPVIVHTDLLVVDSDLKEIAPSLWEMFRISPRILCNLDMLGGHCLVTGCTMMFNKAVRDLSIPMPEAAIMHDVWMALVTFKNAAASDMWKNPPFSIANTAATRSAPLISERTMSSTNPLPRTHAGRRMALLPHAALRGLRLYLQILPP